MKKWDIKSVIAPDLIGQEEARKEEEQKLQALLEEEFEPFAVLYERVWLRRELD